MIVDIIDNSTIVSDTIGKTLYGKDGKYTFKYNKRENHVYVSSKNFYNLIIDRRIRARMRRRSISNRFEHDNVFEYQQLIIDFICDTFYKHFGYECDFTVEFWR